MLRRAGHSAVSSLVVVAFFVQNTGAADVAFLAARHGPPAGVSAAWLPPGALKAAPGPRVGLPAEPWLSKIWTWLAPFIREASVAPAPEFPAPVAASETDLVPAPAPIVADRMLIDKTGFDIVAFGEEIRWRRHSAAPTHEVAAARIDGPWKQQGGLRFRVSYLKPEGFITLSAKGALVQEGTGPAREMGVTRRAPAWLHGRYAIYHEGDQVSFEIELENTTGEELESLEVFTGQEVLALDGGAGRLLGEVQTYAPVNLPAGGRGVLTGKLKVAGAAVARSNFEQTHLSVYQPSERGPGRRLVDEPQAGILDPP